MINAFSRGETRGVCATFVMRRGVNEVSPGTDKSNRKVLLLLGLNLAKASSRNWIILEINPPLSNEILSGIMDTWLNLNARIMVGRGGEWEGRICYHIMHTYNLNFSFHLGLSVCGFMLVALISLAGTGPPSESRCSRRPASRRLKLKRKLCLRCGGESVALLSKPPLMSAERARGVGGSGSGDTGGPPSGCMPSMQYGSEKPAKKNREKQRERDGKWENEIRFDITLMKSVRH